MGELDSMKKQISEGAKLEGSAGRLVVGTVSGIGTSVIAGYVMWAFRGMSLLSSALASLPLWRSFDPLPVLSSWRKREEGEEIDENEEKHQEEDEDSVREIFEHEMDSNAKEIKEGELK
jgi:hypothetical protein